MTKDMSSVSSASEGPPDRVIRVRGGTSEYVANITPEEDDNKVITSQYTWYNFVPLNLFIQFHDKANVYFLFIGLLQLIPSVTTTNGTPTIYFPLTFILFVSAVRAAIEDRGKHKADEARNRSLYWRLAATPPHRGVYGSQSGLSSSLSMTKGANSSNRVPLLDSQDSSESNRRINPVHSPPSGTSSSFAEDDATYWDTITGFPHDDNAAATGGLVSSPSQLTTTASAVLSEEEKLNQRRAMAKKNNRHYRLAESGSIKCGDIIKVYKNQMVPCDMILLGTSEPKGHCFIDKANLNGETALEVFSSLPALRPYCAYADGSGLRHLNATVAYEPPSSNFEQFRCSLTIHSQAPPPPRVSSGSISSTLLPSVSMNNKSGSGNAGAGSIDLSLDVSGPEVISINHKGLLLRETVIRNTSFVVGLAVYTGDDTKIRKSISEGEKPKRKKSRIMRLVDKFILLMFTLQACLCLTGGIYSGIWQYHASRHIYLSLSVNGGEAFVAGLSAAMSWVILLSAMVPISLIVSSEMVKFIQSIFISWDLTLWHEPIKKGARCNTSTIHEDLGLVEYIFSDKTGTLTQNKMEFRYSLMAVKCDTQNTNNTSSSNSSNSGNLSSEEKDANKSSPSASPSPSSSNSSSYISFGSTETDIAKSVKAKLNANSPNGPPPTPWTDLLVNELAHLRGPRQPDKSCMSRSWLSRYYHTTQGFYASSQETLDRFAMQLEKVKQSKDITQQDVQNLNDLASALAKRGTLESAFISDESVLSPSTPPSSSSSSSSSSSIIGINNTSASRNEHGDVKQSTSMLPPPTTLGGKLIAEALAKGAKINNETPLIPVPKEAMDDPRLCNNPVWLGAFEIEERRNLLTLLWSGRWSSSPVGTPAQRNAARRYLTHMALSTTAKPYLTPEGDLDWQFESAEELAMVRFAAACGFVKQADPSGTGTQLQIIEFNTPDLDPLKASLRLEKYHQIATFGFSSRRARVTVVWQRMDTLDPEETGKVHIMCKGQDTMLLPLIRDQSEVDDTLIASLSDMCANGLRTLVAAYSEQPSTWWQSLEPEYTRLLLLDENEPVSKKGAIFSPTSIKTPCVDASQTNSTSSGTGIPLNAEGKPMTVKEQREAFYEEVEKGAGLMVLGCIAMEDKLQNLVPESIRDFGRAGIKVWMITGDKLETARNIALACNLVDADMTVTAPQSATLDDAAKQFGNARLVEVTGQWASLSSNREELSVLFDILDPQRTGLVKLKELQLVLSALRLTISTHDLARMFRDESSITNSNSTVGNGIASPSKDGRTGSATEDLSITKDQFLALMQMSEITMYEAVKADVDHGIALYQSIQDHNKYPISLLVNRDAFRVMFPAKAKLSTTTTSKKVAKKPASSSSSPNADGYAALEEGKEQIPVSTLSSPSSTQGSTSDPTEEQLEQLRDRFFSLASMCKSVVFARAEPAMKKRMVSEMMARFPDAVTLAIGDGANDTEMITTAHIGVGIAGVEGTAATNASDYALGTFRMLHTLLFVHGSWCYKRVAILVNFVFYKAALLCFSNFFFGFFSAFSGQQLFSDPLFQLYNVLFTSYPILAFGILDRALPAPIYENNPALYKDARGTRFTFSVFSGWIFRSFIHAFIIFCIVWMPVILDGNDVLGGGHFMLGKNFGLWHISTLQIISLAILPNFYIFLIMDSITLVHVVSVVCSLLYVAIAVLIFSSSTSVNVDLYGHIPTLFASPQSWLIVILAVAFPTLIELAWKFGRLNLRPTLTQILRERLEIKRHLARQALRTLSSSSSSSSSSTSSGSSSLLRVAAAVAHESSNPSLESSAMDAAGLDARLVGANGRSVGQSNERRRAQEVMGAEAAKSVTMHDTDEEKWQTRGKVIEISTAQKRVEERLQQYSKRFDGTDSQSDQGDSSIDDSHGSNSTTKNSKSVAKKMYRHSVIRAMLQLRSLTGSAGFHSAADQNFEPKDQFVASGTSSSSSSSSSL